MHLVRRGLSALLAQHKSERKTIDVLIASDEEIRDLNNRFRQMDEATDVLSFPSPDWNNSHLGEVAISLPFADRGAKSRRVPLANELAFLAIHGGLHLLGYDDETDEGRDEMVERMNEVAQKIGLKPDLSWSSQEHLMGGSR